MYVSTKWPISSAALPRRITTGSRQGSLGADILAAQVVERRRQRVDDLAFGDIQAQARGDLLGRQRGHKRGQADPGGAPAVEQPQPCRRQRAQQHRHPPGSPSSPNSCGRDHAGHRRHRRDAQVDLAAQQHKGDAGRDHRQRRDLGQDVAQIDQLRKLSVVRLKNTIRITSVINGARSRARRRAQLTRIAAGTGRLAEAVWLISTHPG